MKNFFPKEYKKNRKLRINHSYLVEQFSDYSKLSDFTGLPRGGMARLCPEANHPPLIIIPF